MRGVVLKIVLSNLALLLSVSVFAQNKKNSSERVEASVKNSVEIISSFESSYLEDKFDMNEDIAMLYYKVKLLDRKTDLVNCKMMLMANYMNKQYNSRRERKAYKENIILLDEAIKDTESDILVVNDLMAKEN